MNLEFLIEDKLSEIFSFLDSFISNNNEFKPRFETGTEETLNSFLEENKNKQIYPLIWLLYPYKEQRNSTNVKANNIRLIIAIDNNIQQTTKQRLEGSYKKALYPVFFNIKNLFSKAVNIEVIGDVYELTKYPNYGNFDMSATTTVWDALAVDLGISLNKFCHGLKKIE